MVITNPRIGMKELNLPKNFKIAKSQTRNCIIYEISSFRRTVPSQNALIWVLSIQSISPEVLLLSANQSEQALKTSLYKETQGLF